MKKTIKFCFIFAILSIILAAIGGVCWFKNACLGYIPGEKIEAFIPEGSSGIEIAELLERRKVIKSALAFRIAIKISHSDNFLSGKYTFDSSDSIDKIIERLKKGEQALNLVTIPEGLTIKQTAEILEKENICETKDFLEAASKHNIIINGTKINNLEGYLLPETYDIPATSDAEDVIEMMTKSFDQEISPLYNERKSGLPQKMTLNDIVILASLIEKDAKIPEERPIIAGVYYNRLQRGMNLECDATIQYALGENKKNLLYSDLKIDSPYNTYMYSGLPPGAIANPGRDSLYAALNPVEHDYFFYVLNEIKNDGSHVFSKTAAEHEKAVYKYLKEY